jgi:hypothetical protein
VTYASETRVLEETVIQKLFINLGKKNSKKNIWAHKGKSNMESQNQ